jgi:hypothetical protein
MSARPSNRAAMPDLERMRREANELLSEAGLPLCHSLCDVDDPDTANPTVIGLAGDARYVIKVCTRHPDTTEAQARLANRIAEATGLPISRHYAARQTKDRLPLLVMQWMPGEQLRLLLPALDRARAEMLATDWGRVGPGRDIEPAFLQTNDWMNGVRREAAALGVSDSDVANRYTMRLVL